MALTDRSSEVTTYISNLLKERMIELEIKDVWYGDQNNIPRFPAVAVEPGPFNRGLSGIGGKGRTDNTITVYLLVYNNNIKDVQKTRQDTDQLAEQLMDVLHEDVTMGGLVIHGFVNTIEPGYTVRGNNLLRSSRVTWTGMTKTLIS